MKALKLIFAFAILIVSGILGFLGARLLNTTVGLIDPCLLVVSFPLTIILGAALLSLEFKLLNKMKMFDNF